MDAHYRACIYAGITIGGTNAEVMPAQVGSLLIGEISNVGKVLWGMGVHGNSISVRNIGISINVRNVGISINVRNV